jgi:uncharacterized membrane protein
MTASDATANIASPPKVNEHFKYMPHPHWERRQKPPTHAEQAGTGFNARLALLITTVVGTMLCGYIFAAIALLSLPAAIQTQNLTIIIAWISSNFLQLVLLPIIIVGQNIQAKAADLRAEATYKDAEAIAAELAQAQEHLTAQDAHLSAQDAKLQALIDSNAQLATQLNAALAKLQAGA